MTNGNTYGNTYHFLPIIRRQNHLIMGGTWYVILAFYTSDPMTHVSLFVIHFIICFVKVSGWWGVIRFAQPHIHTYMFCPYVISTPLQFTWRIKNENFQKILFWCNSSHNFTLKRNELRYHCCLSQLHRVLASCCSRKIE
jgi:hypothetical protein